MVSIQKGTVESTTGDADNTPEEEMKPQRWLSSIKYQVASWKLAKYHFTELFQGIVFNMGKRDNRVVSYLRNWNFLFT